MSAEPHASRPASLSRTRAAIQSYLKPRTATMLFLGAACGLPLLTISNVLVLWLTDNGVSMTHIGLFAYTLLPYSFKFVWAPLLDQVRLPVLHRLLGKRLSWSMVFESADGSCSRCGICVAPGLLRRKPGHFRRRVAYRDRATGRTGN